jgi:Uri superfamily endonuclease
MTTSDSVKTSATFPFRMALGMFTYVGVILLVWLVLPGGWFSVTLLALLALTGVFVGVGSVMQTRGLKRRPGRHPTRPPSAT